jgi:hypothetical protein
MMTLTRTLISFLIFSIPVFASESTPVEPDQDILSFHVKNLLHCLYDSASTTDGILACLHPFSLDDKLKQTITDSIQNDGAVQVAKEHEMVLTEQFNAQKINQDKSQNTWSVVTSYDLTLMKKQIEIVRPMQSDITINWNGQDPIRLLSFKTAPVGKESITNYQDLRLEQCPYK